MNGYVGDSRELVLCMLMVKLTKLDTNLSREFIDDAYIAENVEMGELINQVLAFEIVHETVVYLHMERHASEESNHDKAVPLVDCFMKIFSTHILPTFNIVHTQFLYLVPHHLLQVSMQ